ncbi:MAG TPA: hypothetical protein VK668_20265 [Mucilaginibacter sp.]|nr:hypothetical protein [Mucilaginibacter sp.]
MKFRIEYRNNIEERVLTYIEEDYSFDMEPIVKQIDFELILNKLSLSVLNNRIIQLWGYCGLNKNMKSNYEVPKYKKGILVVENYLEHSFAYGINGKDVPIYVNIETGWVCIGNPTRPGNAVEFITNCVAVVNEQQQLISLWLKPNQLPMI